MAFVLFAGIAIAFGIMLVRGGEWAVAGVLGISGGLFVTIIVATLFRRAGHGNPFADQPPATWPPRPTDYLAVLFFVVVVICLVTDRWEGITIAAFLAGFACAIWPVVSPARLRERARLRRG